MKLPNSIVNDRDFSIVNIFLFLFSFVVNFKKHNDSKNVFAFSRTPTTFVSSMIICYFIAGLLDTFWLGGINFIFMFIFWVCFILLAVWLYTKYSGEYAEIGEYIDYFADIIWNNVSKKKNKKKRNRFKTMNMFCFLYAKAFQPAYSRCVQSTMRSMLGHAKTN